MEHDEALKRLKNPEHQGITDLTGLNVQKLRDKKAKRVLEPLLRKVLPRRGLGREHFSYDRELRVKLLPVNPYFQRDIDDLRQVLCLPEGQIAAIDIGQFPDRNAPWDQGDTLDSSTAFGAWLSVHRSVAGKKEIDPFLPPVPQWLIDSASSKLKFGRQAPLPWLSKRPNIPERHAHRFDLKMPLDRCVARLIELYGLPWYSQPNLCVFILTKESKSLENIFPFDVSTNGIPEPEGGALTITVDGIDEYTTKRQWQDIFDRYIAPKQELFWEMRGDMPHSRQMNPEKLQQPWLIEFYNFLVEQERSGERMGIDKALELITKEEDCAPELKEVDRTTLWGNIKRLEGLCRPQG